MVPGPRLRAYLALERAMVDLADAGDAVADELRDRMDPIWRCLTEEEHRALDNRSGDASVFAGELQLLVPMPPRRDISVRESVRQQFRCKAACSALFQPATSASMWFWGGWCLVERLPGKESATVLLRGGPGTGKTLLAVDVALALAGAPTGDVLVACVELLPSEFVAQIQTGRGELPLQYRDGPLAVLQWQADLIVKYRLKLAALIVNRTEGTVDVAHWPNDVLARLDEGGPQFVPPSRHLF